MKLKTKLLTLLIGCPDHRNLLRFPTEGGEFHGFTYLFDDSVPLEAFIAAKVEEAIGVSKNIEFLQLIDTPLKSGADLSRLAVVRVSSDEIEAEEDWPTLPIILRAMSSGSNRLIYNKAFQVYAGANAHSYDALEVDDEVRKRLQELAKDDKLN